MISKVECVIIECDHCLDIYENSSGYSIFVDACNALEDLLDDGWFKEKVNVEKHYCPICTSGFDEDSCIPLILDESRKDLHKVERE